MLNASSTKTIKVSRFHRTTAKYPVVRCQHVELQKGETVMRNKALKWVSKTMGHGTRQPAQTLICEMS